MSRSPRTWRRAVLPLVAPLLWFGCRAEPTPSPVTPAPPAPAAEPRIEWQRSLDDALHLARQEQRPLFVALNMDGESASDRVWRENYRDPGFVAAANQCVCVAGSLFRHNQRDHDEQGRRIPCPRFGGVTCGEHLAIEPLLFERLLADGERVAPRHALVLPDGSKTFDLSLSFDLRDVDRALAAAVRDLPARERPDFARMTWAELAARRDHAGRQALEARLDPGEEGPRAIDLDQEGRVLAALDAIAAHGDAGSLEALRLVDACGGWDARGSSPALRKALVAAASARGLGPALAAVWRDRVEAGDFPVPVDRGSSFELIAQLDGLGTPTRSFLLAHCVLQPHAAAALRALRMVLPAADAAAVAAIATEGMPVVGEVPAARSPSQPPTTSEEPSAAEELERTLEELDAQDKTVPAPDRAAWNARYAKASLDLARRRLESGGRDAQVLLEDAELHWQRALAAAPDHADWWIERARTAFFLGRFAEQAEHGGRAFALATRGADDGGRLGDPVAVEALRWVGDAHARQLGERAQVDPASELRGIAAGLHALWRVAGSAHGTAKDWLSLSSFAGALGLRGREFAYAAAGARALPADRELWLLLLAAVRLGPGRLVPSGVAAGIAADHPGSADAAWWTGYAHVLVAEDARRAELEPWPAWSSCAHYAAAQHSFERAMAENPAYAPSCRQMVALTWLGRGHALVYVDRRGAADCLVEAVRTAPQLASLRDGLGYDVLDLVDKILEWRAAGPSEVDSGALLERLLALAPDTAFYGLAIADAELREALRADGRNPERVLRDTVDAAGNRIRMPMGLPTAEGDGYLQRS
ncbi:MAG: hypothetical protein FJ265_12050, partial [Planctomycetes bacterium]|nr:hypothetical protein [Planctomycetota bacterium]